MVHIGMVHTIHIVQYRQSKVFDNLAVKFITKQFLISFMLYVKWSSDPRYKVHVHYQRQ